MLTILSLFGRSPFAPLQSHMESVARCVYKLPSLCEAIEVQNQLLIENISDEISAIENQADKIKNDIRKHLSKSLYLPIDRSSLLDILSIQDSIADTAEDIAVVATFKPLEILSSFKDEFKQFLLKNIETFDGAKLIINELHELVESSFGGKEAEKVRSMIDEVASKEHEVDLIQRLLLKKLFQSEANLTYITFSQWQRLIENLASISNLSENLANRVRMILELK
jgi:predicted phosphate transport protein (TIGR00153 family)